MVAPDGTIYFGLWASRPFNGSRGFMLHFTADLTQSFTPGAFGWDDTPSVVPASMVPSYHGTSSYLILTKYNNYFAGEVGPTGGNGINKIAILDPYATEVDPNNDGVSNFLVMNEVLTIDAPTPDQEAIDDGYPYGGREWCVNATAVDPFTKSALLNSEDGRFYRWDLTSNTLTESIIENPIGVGEPYTPTAIGMDGTIYGINGGFLFAMGGLGNYTLKNVASAGPIAPGQAVTFTTTLAPTSTGPTPTGSVSYYDGSISPANLLSTVSLLNGQANYSTSSLDTGTHFIIALYDGDSTYASGSTMLPEVVLNGTTTTITSSTGQSAFGSTVTFTATVSAADSTPTTKVLFKDGNTVLANVDLVNGKATYTTSALSVGQHVISAIYRGEGGPNTTHIPAVGTVTQKIQGTTSTVVTGNPSSSVFGQTVTMSATVSALVPGAGIPVGTVTFMDGAKVLASGIALDSTGHASFSTSALNVARHTITASFTGTGGWLNSNNSTNEVVSKSSSTSTLISSLNPAGKNKRVIFMAMVTANEPGAGILRGTVTFKDGNTVLGTTTLNSSGQATFTTSSLKPGFHNITAVYNGDTNFTTSTSAVLRQFISKQTNPSLKDISMELIAYLQSLFSNK
jgi:hypothetical protein